MNETLDAEVIADLEMMLKETKAQTSIMATFLQTFKEEQVAIHPLITERAQVLSKALEGAMKINSAAFEARPGDTERQIRSKLDDAFRAETIILKELLRMDLKTEDHG